MVRSACGSASKSNSSIDNLVEVVYPGAVSVEGKVGWSCSLPEGRFRGARLIVGGRSFLEIVNRLAEYILLTNTTVNGKLNI